MAKKDKLQSGFFSENRDNYYIFGGKMLLESFFANSIGVFQMRVLKEKYDPSEPLPEDTDSLVDTNIPATQLVFTDVSQIETVIKHLESIRNKMKL